MNNPNNKKKNSNQMSSVSDMSVQPVMSMGTPTNGGKKSSGKFIIITIIVLLVIAGAVSAIFLFGEDKEKSKDNVKDSLEEQKDEVIPTMVIEGISYDYVYIGTKADVDSNTMCDIYKSTDGEDFEYLVSVNCNGVYFNDYHVEQGTTYYYKAKVKDGNKYSEVVSATTSNETKPSVDNKSYTYSGFRFKEINGYTYYSETDKLNIMSEDHIFMIGVLPYNYNDIKSSSALSQLKLAFESEGNSVNNMGVRTFNGVEMVTAELIYTGIEMLYILTDAGNGYVFQGIISSTNLDVNYNCLNEFLNIINNVEYVGGHSDYTTDRGFSIDI